MPSTFTQEYGLVPTQFILGSAGGTGGRGGDGGAGNGVFFEINYNNLGTDTFIEKKPIQPPSFDALLKNDPKWAEFASFARKMVETLSQV